MTNEGILVEGNQSNKWAEVWGNGVDSMRYLLSSLGMVSASLGSGDGQVVPKFVSLLSIHSFWAIFPVMICF